MSNLILLRHGQSQWNKENRFTGWEDVPLTNEGIKEAKLAGKIMKKHSLDIDYIFSSILQRANKTAEIAIKEMNLNKFWQNNDLIMTCSQSLNERDYGSLVGLNKKETAEKYGKDQVHIWRRSFHISPPGGESLKDVVKRVSPYFNKFIKIHLNKDKNVLIVAHGNSLRATLIEVGLYKAEEISNIELPTGRPFLISFAKGQIISSKFLT